MVYKFKYFKLVQTAIYLGLFSLIIFGNFSAVTRGILSILNGLVISIDLILKYISEWRANRHIENKSKLIKDILVLLIFIIVLFLINYNKYSII